MTGSELREIRVRLGLKPSEMAEKLGVARNSLYRLQSGQRRITRTIIRSVALLCEAEERRQCPPDYS